MSSNFKKIWLPLLTLLLVVGCKFDDEKPKEEQIDTDEDTNSTYPSTLKPKYCAPNANVLEYKNGKYWFYVNETLEIETEGGYSEGELNLTATFSMQGQSMDVVIIGKPDNSGQSLILNIVVSQAEQIYFAQKFFALAAINSECSQMEMANLPKFTGSSFDLNQINRITRFRSSYGHSYTDAYESCRSMKHYIEPNEYSDHYINIYAPFKARVVAYYSENDPVGDDGINNQHVILQSVNYPALQFDYFHIEMAQPLVLGSIVEENTVIGWGDLNRNGQIENNLDVAVRVNSLSGLRLISMFDVLSEEALTQYNSWSGLSTREDYQISQVDRDTNPLQCNGEIFVNEEFEPYYNFNWIAPN